MKIRTSLLFLPVFGILVACQTTNDDPVKESVVSSLADGRVGEIIYTSTSPYSPKEALAHSGGMKDEVAVSGDLVIPDTAPAEGKIPAMILVHGSGGKRGNAPGWENLFHEMGIATFEIDSFTPRGVTKSIGDQSRVRHSMMVSDAFNALELLATHPRIDPDRIGVIGWSKGGTVSKFTAWEPRRKSEIDGDLKFALHIPVYPACAQFDAYDFTGSPMMFLLGEKDNWTPIEPCLKAAEGIAQSGADVTLKTYPNTHHGFDSPHPVSTNKNAWRWDSCDFWVHEDGSQYEKSSGGTMDNPANFKRVFAECASKGTVKAGGNSSAYNDALKDTETFVRRVFKLGSS